MKHAAKRLLSACLALLLVVGLVPAALAAEPGVLTEAGKTVTNVNISTPSGDSVEVGQTLRLAAQVQPDDTGNPVTWDSDSPGIASVDNNGVVTGKNAGSCEVQGVLSCLSGAVCSVQVTVRSNSEALSRYLDSIKDQTIQAENGTALALYASKAIDADGDGTNELLLYYTGGRSCQIDIAKETGGEIKRSTAFFAATDSSKTCRLDIYMDNTTGNVVLCENYVSENGASQTTEFSFNAYKDGKYTADSQTYKIVANGSGEENAAYYIDGQKVKKDAFDLATGHYG